MDFLRFFLDSQCKNDTLQPWKIRLLRGTLVKNKEISRFDFTCILFKIVLSFWHDFPIILDRFYIFFGRRFPYAFLDMFFVTFGTKMAPKRLPKSTQNLKKNQKCALQFNWYVPDAVLTPFWMHFGRHLGGFRNLLVAICYRCWQFWVAPWASSGHHRFARCQLWSDTLNFPSCD